MSDSTIIELGVKYRRKTSAELKIMNSILNMSVRCPYVIQGGMITPKSETQKRCQGQC